MYRGSVYGGQKGGLASRMDSYSESGGGSSMWDAIGGALGRGQELREEAGDDSTFGERAKGWLSKKAEKIGYKPRMEHDGKVYNEAQWGEHKGLDFMQDDKGLFQKGGINPEIGEAWGNVREYFGDRLNSQKKSQQPTTGDGNVANTVIENADPTTVNATAEGTQEGANTMESKMADYRSRDGGKGWDPSGEDWFDESQAEQFGWVGGKWQDPVQPAQENTLSNASQGGYGIGMGDFLKNNKQPNQPSGDPSDEGLIGWLKSKWGS